MNSNCIKQIILASVVSMVNISSSQASACTVIYVDADALPGGTGASWHTAYQYLQDALSEAESQLSGNNGQPNGGRGVRSVITSPSESDPNATTVEIWVAQGVYTPDQGANQTPGDRIASFNLISGISLKGGYAGLGMPDPNVRDVRLYQTVLSGDLAGDDIEVEDPRNLRDEPTRAENSCNVVEIVSASGVRLEGFRITGGLANIGGRDEVMSTQIGAGLRADGVSDLTIKDSIFVGNWASSHGGGGEIFGDRVMVNNCSFSNNYSNMGGGLWVKGSGILVSECEIETNYGANGGGVLAADDVAFIDCVFSENSGGAGGGARLSSSKAKFVSCVIKNNSASWGGGVVIDGSQSWATYDFNKCVFYGNEAVTDGGAMNISSKGSVNLSNCILLGNKAKDGGTIYASSFDKLRIENCTVSENRAGKGEFALLDAQYLATLGPARIMNSIIVQSDNAICTADMAISLDYSLLSGGMNSIIDPNNNLTWGIGNISVDPGFVDSGHWDNNGTPKDPNDDFYVVGDYHLKSQGGRWNPVSNSWVTDDATSPCIDTGDPMAPIGLEPFPNGGRINMGAYGSTAEASKSYFGEPLCETVIAGDINGDCLVNFEDLKILVDHWLEDTQ